MLLNKQQLMVTGLLCSAALYCNADDSYQAKPDMVKPAPQTTVLQPPAPLEEPPALWQPARDEDKRRPNSNMTVRGRAKLYPQEEMPRRIKLGDPAQ